MRSSRFRVRRRKSAGCGANENGSPASVKGEYHADRHSHCHSCPCGGVSLLPVPPFRIRRRLRLRLRLLEKGRLCVVFRHACAVPARKRRIERKGVRRVAAGLRNVGASGGSGRGRRPRAERVFPERSGAPGRASGGAERRCPAARFLPRHFCSENFGRKRCGPFPF